MLPPQSLSSSSGTVIEKKIPVCNLSGLSGSPISEIVRESPLSGEANAIPKILGTRFELAAATHVEHEKLLLKLNPSMVPMPKI